MSVLWSTFPRGVLPVLRLSSCITLGCAPVEEFVNVTFLSLSKVEGGSGSSNEVETSNEGVSGCSLLHGSKK